MFRITHYEKTILNIIAQEGGYTSASKIAYKRRIEIHSLNNVLGLLGKKGLISVFSGRSVFTIGRVELTSKGWKAIGKTEGLYSRKISSETPEEKYKKWISSQ